MTLWIDAQLPPALVAWMAATFAVETRAVRDLGRREAKDSEIFRAARAAKAVVMTKDSEFVELVERHGPTPQILWVTCGNTTNARLRDILTRVFPTAVRLLQQNESLVEIGDVS